ncbi:diphthine--ammonia ligase-like isoform X1 [Amphibalanus amphitrite]|uniref:diphthine--ammonia ligase-like isoform X1 n=1 Tax=Amphibalanus amphitrite TaxID=1232801 RepID=UPI001C9092DE|nr:diphthine--ammonia ligase-like isoform X1 [Amphibalanus amphitrite]
MRVVALVSGGKDSCYNMIQCVREGHAVVALANLHPPQSANDEMDSYMYQTVGHNAIALYAEAMELPLYRASIRGSACASDREYSPTEGDEVEDLHRLLSKIKEELDFEAVSVGAILSDYQRVRVENVCSRLGLTSLSFLWRRDQSELLTEMVACRVHAVLVKVAALGLLPDRHLGQTLEQIRPHMERMKGKYGLNVCGEGGEYETFTLDCPLFKKRIVIDEQEVVTHSDDAFAPVAYLNFTRTHLEDKQLGDLTQAQRIAGLPATCERPELFDSPPPVDGSTDPPSEDATAVPEPTVAESAGWVWVGPIEGRADGGRSGMEAALDTLTESLSSRGLAVSDLTSVALFVSRMSRYAALNSEYVRRLGGSRPARLCVQAPLPAGSEVRLEVTALRAAAAHRRHMHVQSVSHWAPANIGPYSQSVMCGEVLYVAGMIGLDPASMRLVRGGEQQARLALRHVERVIQASSNDADTDTVVQTVCYVTDPSLLPACSALMTARLASSLQCAVVVPGLPRGAAVEWHVWTHAHNAQFLSECRQSSLELDGAAMDVSLRWSGAHRLSAATVLCSAGGDGRLSAGQLTGCLRSTVGCLRSKAGQGAVCHFRVFHCVEDGAAVAEAALSVRGPLCVVTPVPVTAVGDGVTRRVAVTALAMDAAREKRD